MNPRPVTLAPNQRALLREFERLHEEWRRATAAADAAECLTLQEKRGAQRLLEYRIAADQVHQRAMQLLRDTPI
jgi:hypothetical protein